MEVGYLLNKRSFSKFNPFTFNENHLHREYEKQMDLGENKKIFQQTVEKGKLTK